MPSDPQDTKRTVGQSVLAPRKPRSLPDVVEEGVIVGSWASFAIVRFPAKTEADGKRLCATTVRIRWDLLQPKTVQSGERK
jgi:hypothetical protein